MSLAVPGSVIDPLPLAKAWSISAPGLVVVGMCVGCHANIPQNLRRDMLSQADPVVASLDSLYNGASV